MADTTYRPLGTVATPADWQLPGSLELLLKQVYAEFDGTGAAAAFLPAVVLKDDKGDTMGVYPCGSQVAAGGSADVTWFPGVKPTAATPTLSVPQIVFQAEWVVGAGGTNVLPPSGAITLTEPANYYPAVFAIHDDGTYNYPECLEVGFYWWDALWVAYSDLARTTISPIATSLTVDIDAGQFMEATDGTVPAVFPTYSNGWGYASGVFNIQNGQDMFVDGNNSGGSDIYVSLTLRMAKLDANTGVA